MNIDEYALDDDIAAIATALAPAALSVIRTSGKNSFEKFASIFSRSQALLQSDGHRLLYGWIVDGDKKLDEVVVCTYRSPKSFTGEDAIEVICHGGLEVTYALFSLILGAGFRQAKPGEFTFRSFVSGKSDLTKAEAIKEIIDAKSQHVVAHAASHLSGSLFESITAIKSLLLRSIAEISVTIEYPEDEIQDEPTIQIAPFMEVKGLLSGLIQYWEQERIFADGAKVVLAGATNAGKSKLFNTLVHQERSIVSEIEGTTRDWIDADMQIKGIPITLYDTAGLRFTNEKIESIGIHRTHELTKTSDLLLYLVDSTKGISESDIQFLESKDAGQLNMILIFTKQDLLDEDKAQKLLENFSQKAYCRNPLFISAQTGVGIDKLIDAMYSLLIKNPLDVENLTVGTLRQKLAVENALLFVDKAITNAGNGMPVDTIVLDLEEALHSLGELTGEITSDDILGEVFLHFCVGK
ncbi:MAG: tRNA uridine-5-carboxymethylaminomethyl(34) synthesis GTPase MnmE [Spirochaetaceae bacterium]|nr:tRNA uridine-5-carboxymethylaminomethyl(34) synthesis GTPase MnmE [Spirochaetaceae bacterium]